MDANLPFGRLTTIEPIAGGRYWLCQCDCGNTTKARKWDLENDRRVSCGCKPKSPTVVCPACGQEKPRTGEHFYLRENGALQRKTCKPCVVASVTAKKSKHYEDLRKKGKCRICGSKQLVENRMEPLCTKCHTKRKRQLRQRGAEVKATVMARYGGKCACPGGCDEARIEFLTIDHTNGDGAAHRSESHISGGKLYSWLIRNNFPPGFRVLCYNCNCSRGNLGYCPHERE